MALRNSNLHERVAKVEANVESISNSLAEIKRAIHDVSERMERGFQDQSNRFDKLIYWGCSTILGTFIALSIQLWLRR